MASVARRQQQISGTTGGGQGRRRPAPVRRRRTTGQMVAAFFGYTVTALLLLSLAGIGYGFFLIRSTMQSLPDIDSLADTLPGGATEIYATDIDPETGKNVVLGRIFTQYKEFAPITELPQSVQDATVAVEDERFYTHRGVDMRGIGRALYRDVRGGKMGEGGSTLTQQLARNVFLNQKKNVKRKIQEAILAIQLEKSYSKEQILQMYLNEVCYGANSYGIKAAAKMYFGKSPKQLTLAESALLAGLPQQPARLEPFEHLSAALERRNVVLAKMREQNYITEAQYQAALAEKPKMIPERRIKPADFKAPYFTTYVLRQLIAKYGKDAVYHGGLRVYTTLNYKMQGEAERAIANGVMDGHDDGVTEGALVSLEPHTGFIRAMVGGVDYRKNQFNNITQGGGRQPGSSFKVFVYTAAFMSDPHKFSPDTEIDDAPVTFGKGRYAYSPHNFDKRFHGGVTIRRALTYSYNVPAVKTANMVGIQKVIETAHAMGIRSKLTPDLSLALGSNAVNPIDLCSAYSVFPNRGNHAAPMAIWKVVDGDGKVLEENAPQVTKGVVPETVVDEMSSMLRDVVDHGTAASAKDIHEVEDAHGKTGTTNDSRDAWFVGYTPELTTAVWVCGVKRVEKNGRLIAAYPPMAGVTGGHVCAPIWARFMKAAVPIQRLAAVAATPDAAGKENTGAAKDAEMAKALKAAASGEGADTGKSADDNSSGDSAVPHRRRHRPEPTPFDDTATGTTPAPDTVPGDNTDGGGGDYRRPAHRRRFRRPRRAGRRARPAAARCRKWWDNGSAARRYCRPAAPADDELTRRPDTLMPTLRRRIRLVPTEPPRKRPRPVRRRLRGVGGSAVPERTTVSDAEVPVGRLRFFAVGAFLGIAALIGRLWFLQVYSGDAFRAQAEDNRLRPIREVAPRGIIEDSAGRVLVTNSAQFTVYILPSELPHDKNKEKDIAAKADVYHQLAQVLGISDSDLAALIKRRDPGGSNPIPIAEGVSDHVMARIAENRLRLRGVRTDVEPVRVYPGGKLAAHLLGIIGPIEQKELDDESVQERGYQPGDFIGKTGVEKEYDQFLTGEAGGSWYEVDAKGRQRGKMGENAVVPGATLTLGLNRDVQVAAEAALGGRKGAAVAVDPRDGRVLAYVSSPAFDPSVFARRPLLHATYQNIQASGAQNDRASALSQPPGSTFKIITSAAALATGTVNATTNFFCAGGIRMGHYFKKCHSTHGSVDMDKALEASCDVYFYRAGLAMGPDPIADWSRTFGLGAATGIDLPNESPGLVPSPAWKKAYAARRAGRDGTWHPGDTANIAIGQGDVKATPLQMALVAGAIANGGTIYAPRVLLKAVSAKNNETVYAMKPEATHHLGLKPEQIAEIAKGMRQVIIGPRGTAHKAALPNIAVAGKSGSAETKGGGPTHAWFVCYAPFDAPTIAICVFLDADGKKLHGGADAAPVARKMMVAYFHTADTGGDAGGIRAD